MGLFNLGRKRQPAPNRPTLPVDDVVRMKQQGFTNNQIVQALQRSGYKMHEIFDAMNQADLRAAGPIEGVIPPELAESGSLAGSGSGSGSGPQMSMQGAPAYQQDVSDEFGNRNPTGGPSPGGSFGNPESAGGANIDLQEQDVEERLEEVAEAIIEEKWEDLMRNINKLLEWKENIENQMAALEQGFKDLKSNFDTLQSSVLGRITDYDKSMKSVGTDLKAMETVFQKILPSLTENVSELSRLTKKASASSASSAKKS